MSDTQLQNKISDLQFWLDHNSNHPDYCLKHQEKRTLENQLMKSQLT